MRLKRLPRSKAEVVGDSATNLLAKTVGGAADGDLRGDRALTEVVALPLAVGADFLEAFEEGVRDEDDLSSLGLRRSGQKSGLQVGVEGVSGHKVLVLN